MSGRKYPLEPLVRLRQQQVDGATEKLAHAIAEREAAERKRLAAEHARAETAAAAEGVRDVERAALAKGELRAGDLQHAQAWEFGVAEQQRRLSQHVAAAVTDEERARGDEESARVELASREADSEVTDKDKERFEAKAKRQELAKEEEAAAELRPSNARRRDGE